MADDSFWEEVVQELKLIFAPVESADTGQVLLPSFVDEGVQLACIIGPLLCLLRHLLSARDWKTKLWSQLKEINDKLDADSGRTQELVELLRSKKSDNGSDDTDIWGNYQAKSAGLKESTVDQLPPFRDARLDKLLRRAVDEGLTSPELVQQMHSGAQDGGPYSEAILFRMWDACLKQAAPRINNSEKGADDLESQQSTEVSSLGMKKHRRGSIMM